MKNIFIIYFSVFALNAFSDLSSSYVIVINHTDHDMKVTANFWKGVIQYPLQVVLPPLACLKIHQSYYYRDHDYMGHIFAETHSISPSFVTKWLFVPESLHLLIDDGSAYKSFEEWGFHNYKVTGEFNAMWSFFDSFKLHWSVEPNKHDHISGTCSTFVPEEALFVGGDGSTRLHDAVFARDYKKVDHLLKNGAEMYLKNKEGRTPLDIVNQLGDEYMLSIFQRYGRWYRGNLFLEYDQK